MHSRRFLWMCPWTKWCRDYVRMPSESEHYCPPTKLGTIPYIFQTIECLCFPSSIVLAMPTKCSKRTLITQKRCTNEPTSHWYRMAGKYGGKIFWRIAEIMTFGGIYFGGWKVLAIMIFTAKWLIKRGENLTGPCTSFDSVRTKLMLKCDRKVYKSLLYALNLNCFCFNSFMRIRISSDGYRHAFY